MDSQLNRTEILNSTKKEEYAFMASMRNFWHNLWFGFKRYCIVILLFVLAITSAIYLYGEFSYVPRYETSVTFFAKPLVPNKSTTTKDVYYYNDNIIIGPQFASSFPHIFQSGILKEIVQNDLGTAYDAVITASSVADTNYFKVTVNSNTPENAKKIADSLMKNYPKVAEVVLGDLKTEIKIPSKLPTAPCNKNDKWVLTLFAFVISVFLSAGFLFLYAINRKNVCTKDDIKYGLNQPFICEIPFVKGKKNATNKFEAIVKSKGFTESMRTIKNRIIDTITENNFKTIGVVSTSNNEGKTTIAAGLAKILSGKTESTILVTIDYGAAHQIDGTENQKDKSCKIFKKKEVALKATTTPVAKKLFDNVDLLVLPSKITSDKKKTAEILKTLKENYTYVIIDIAPGYSNSESVSLLNFCDAYIPVIRCDYVPTSKIKNTLDYFSYSNARNLGVILNGVSATYSSYGRYSNYGKYRKYAYGYNYYSYGRYGENLRD